MPLFDGLRNWLLSPLLSVLDAEDRHRVINTDKARAYRTGDQPDTLKYTTALGQANDNIILNFIGLAVDRSVSMLFGKGVDFNIEGEDDSPESLYLDAVMDANKEELLLHTLALYGAESGTCYLRILPEGIVGKDGKLYPRLVALDPAYVDIDTEAEDIEIVRSYCMRYPVKGPDGKPAIRKIEIERDEAGNWQTVSSIEQGSAQALVTDVTLWPYDFPPVIHCKNLPTTGTPYGQPDITPDVIRLQDRINFTASNISKIIRLYAHPVRIGKGVSKQDVIDVGPDKMLLINQDAEIIQLPALGDLPAAQEFYSALKQSIFDVTRTVDITSLQDKVGALTNFGLRILYQDAMQKLATKRELYGDMLEELSRRLLIIGGNPNPPEVEVYWPEPLPQNEQDTTAGLQFDIDNGLVSKQTASMKRGYNFVSEQERIDAELTASYNQTPEL